MVSETRVGFGVRLANVAGDAHDRNRKIAEPDMPLRMPLAASVITGPLLCCTLQPNHSHSPSRDSNWAEDSPRTSARQ